MSRPTTWAWWRDKNVQLVDSTYVPSEGGQRELAENSKILGIFFGSLSNRSTQHFIKYLDKLVSYTKEEGDRFGLIHVPLDAYEADAVIFTKSLVPTEGWLILPWANEKIRTKVKEMYGIQDASEPQLIIVKNNGNGSLITKSGKEDLLDYGYFAWREWVEAARALNKPN